MLTGKLMFHNKPINVDNLYVTENSLGKYLLILLPLYTHSANSYEETIFQGRVDFSKRCNKSLLYATDINIHMLRL